MAKNTQEQVKDPGLANALWRLQQCVIKKEAKKNWRPPQPRPREPSERYRGHTENMKEEANFLKKRITAERDD